MRVGKVDFAKLRKCNHNGKTYKNYEMKNLTTFKIGGKCKYFLKICTLENFIKVMLYLEKISVVPIVFGNGSNILISDKGYNGVIISFGGDFGICNQYDDILEFGVGVSLGVAYAEAKKLNFSGLEDSAGIPATIGGAVYMNAGAYNFEMSKIVDYVVAYVGGKITYFTNADCKFSYRHSVFQENGAIILRVGLKLEHKEKAEIENRFFEVMCRRKQSQPLEYGSAGCVFKRRDDIIVSKALDDAGLKGLSIGGAKVSEKHANFIINYNNATAQNVYDLIKLVKSKFIEIYNIDLECEIQFLGEFDETKR